MTEVIWLRNGGSPGCGKTRHRPSDRQNSCRELDPTQSRFSLSSYTGDMMSFLKTPWATNGVIVPLLQRFSPPPAVPIQTSPLISSRTDQTKSLPNPSVVVSVVNLWSVNWQSPPPAVPPQRLPSR